MNKGNNLILKKWTNKDDGNEPNDNPPIMYKTPLVSNSPAFSVGDTWTVTADRITYKYKVMAVEHLVLPIGEYRCFKIREELNGINNHYWFAPNVGLVKCSIGRGTAVLEDYYSKKKEVMQQEFRGK